MKKKKGGSWVKTRSQTLTVKLRRVPTQPSPPHCVSAYLCLHITLAVDASTLNFFVDAKIIRGKQINPAYVSDELQFIRTCT